MQTRYEVMIMNSKVNKDHVETLYDVRFLRMYDHQYAENRHYFSVSRRKPEDLVAKLPDDAFRQMLPDAVTIAVVLHLPGNQTRLLMSYEYRYPIGQFCYARAGGSVR